MTTTPGRYRPLVPALLLALAPTLALGDEGATSLALAAPVEAAAPTAGDPLTLRLASDEEGGGRAPEHPENRYRLRPPFEEPGFQRYDVPADKNTPLAVGEIVGINIGMWFFSYWLGHPFSKISFDTIAQNFNKGWIIDTDPFWVNQLGHPYEGSLFFNAARSTGHNFYESVLGSFLGSYIWESFMEVQSPSVNDQITTPGGGSVFGEVLYRSYRLLLDSAPGKPSFWRRAGALIVDPVAAGNEWLFGDRYRGPTLLPPSFMLELHLGMVIAGGTRDLETGASKTQVGPWASVAAHLTYGVPGTPGLRLREPFDHFDFRADFAFAGQEEPTASLLIRGTVVGGTVGPATDWGGLWGLFATYDVIGVPLFKATGFGLGPGVSLRKQWGWFELEGTALAELLPWAGGGSIQKLFARDYHYGPGVCGVLDTRVLFGDRVFADVEFREYFISGAYATGSSEDVSWGRLALTGRIAGPHAATVAADLAYRHASYVANPTISQRGAVFQAYYTFLSGW
ncbi:MAG TPA: DUF3943 domain-containing protein [Anaeromyxobacteraceae bacterium]|nr:DUF3943 domain-containing protein [Anaeromyxobacteraceae bacterium]